jgi:hypothetical protein
MFRKITLAGWAVLGLALCARAADGPAVTITLGPRDAKATPTKECFAHTGGGNIDVQQPAPDTVVITMTGVAVAGAHPCKASAAGFTIHLHQELEVAFADPKVKAAQVTLDGRVIGLLRSHGGAKKAHGSAEISAASAAVNAGPAEIVALALPAHAVSGGENLSINDKAGPCVARVGAGRFTLHQAFAITVTHPCSLLPCKAASAEFAPDPALDPLWISAFEPFHGAAKKDFGFQITLKVAPAEEAPAADPKK